MRHLATTSSSGSVFLPPCITDSRYFQLSKQPGNQVVGNPSHGSGVSTGDQNAIEQNSGDLSKFSLNIVFICLFNNVICLLPVSYTHLTLPTTSLV